MQVHPEARNRNLRLLAWGCGEWILKRGPPRSGSNNVRRDSYPKAAAESGHDFGATCFGGKILARIGLPERCAQPAQHTSFHGWRAVDHARNRSLRDTTVRLSTISSPALPIETSYTSSGSGAGPAML